MTCKIKYKIIYNIEQTTAMNKISQQRQQRQQRRPSRPGRRRAGPVQGAAGQAGWDTAAAAAAATVISHSQVQFALCYMLSYICMQLIYIFYIYIYIYIERERQREKCHIVCSRKVSKCFKPYMFKYVHIYRILNWIS